MIAAEVLAMGAVAGAVAGIVVGGGIGRAIGKRLGHEEAFAALEGLQCARRELDCAELRRRIRSVRDARARGEVSEWDLRGPNS